MSPEHLLKFLISWSSYSTWRSGYIANYISHLMIGATSPCDVDMFQRISGPGLRMRWWSLCRGNILWTDIQHSRYRYPCSWSRCWLALLYLFIIQAPQSRHHSIPFDVHYKFVNDFVDVLCADTQEYWSAKRNHSYIPSRHFFIDCLQRVVDTMSVRQLFLGFFVCLQLTAFFLAAAMSLWINELIHGAISQISTSSHIYHGLFIATTSVCSSHLLCSFGNLTNSSMQLLLPWITMASWCVHFCQQLFMTIK